MWFKIGVTGRLFCHCSRLFTAIRMVRASGYVTSQELPCVGLFGLVGKMLSWGMVAKWVVLLTVAQRHHSLQGLAQWNLQRWMSGDLQWLQHIFPTHALESWNIDNQMISNKKRKTAFYGGWIVNVLWLSSLPCYCNLTWYFFRSQLYTQLEGHWHLMQPARLAYLGMQCWIN